MTKKRVWVYDYNGRRFWSVGVTADTDEEAIEAAKHSILSSLSFKVTEEGGFPEGDSDSHRRRTQQS